MLQNATPLRKSALWPPNISDEHVFCTTPATQNSSLQILFKCPTPAIVFGHATKPSRFAHFWEGAQSLAPATRNDIWTLNLQKWSEPLVFLTFWLRNVLRATTACTFSTSQLPKVARTSGVLDILTSKCASRHKGVHFFDISTSKSGPDLVCFCTFWLRNVLRATTAHFFDIATSQSAPKLRCFVHFGFEMCFAPQRRAIFHLSSGQMARAAPVALASLLFDPPEPQISGKTQCFATFLPFRASASSFFWLFLFSDLLSTRLFSLTLSISAFHLSILSEVWLLNFLRSYIASNNYLSKLTAWSSFRKPKGAQSALFSTSSISSVSSISITCRVRVPSLTEGEGCGSLRCERKTGWGGKQHQQHRSHPASVPHGSFTPARWGLGSLGSLHGDVNSSAQHQRHQVLDGKWPPVSQEDCAQDMAHLMTHTKEPVPETKLHQAHQVHHDGRNLHCWQ